MARCSCVLTGTGVTGTLTLSQPSEVGYFIVYKNFNHFI